MDLSRRGFLGQSIAALSLSQALAAAPVRKRALQSTGDGKALLAGAARVDITPPPGLNLWGYSNPEQVAEGVRDPLFARALALQAGGLTIGLVVLDMGRVPTAEVRDKVRGTLAKRGFDDIIFMATHTHSGPYVEALAPSHLQALESGLIASLESALSRLEPAGVAVGRTAIDINFNRRFIRDGECWMKWRNEERLPNDPIDREAGVIRFDSLATCKPLAVLVNYACHPVIFGPDNRQYSADWPGAMTRIVGEETGAECFFLQGGAGDVNPYLDKTPVTAGGAAAVDGEGKKAADAVLAVLAELRPAAPAHPSMAYLEEPVQVGMRFDLEDPEQAAILKAVYGPIFDKYLAGLTKDYSVNGGVLLLNQDLALSFVPGELFVQLQLDLKKGSPVKDTFMCGYANDFHVYFPTIKDAAYGGYGGKTVTFVGVGAGEKLVNHAHESIGKMTGRLGPLKGPEDFALLEL